MNTLLDLLKPVHFQKNRRTNENLLENTFSLYHVKAKTHYIYFGKNSPFFHTFKSLGIYEMENELFLVGSEDLTGELKITNPNKGARVNSSQLIAYLIERFSLKYDKNKIHQAFTITKIAERIYKIDKP